MMMMSMDFETSVFGIFFTKYFFEITCFCPALKEKLFPMPRSYFVQHRKNSLKQKVNLTGNIKVVFT